MALPSYTIVRQYAVAGRTYWEIGLSGTGVTPTTRTEIELPGCSGSATLIVLVATLDSGPAVSIQPAFLREDVDVPTTNVAYIGGVAAAAATINQQKPLVLGPLLTDGAKFTLRWNPNAEPADAVDNAVHAYMLIADGVLQAG
jgi:hypothetical protein